MSPYSSGIQPTELFIQMLGLPAGLSLPRSTPFQCPPLLRTAAPMIKKSSPYKHPNILPFLILPSNSYSILRMDMCMCIPRMCSTQVKCQAGNYVEPQVPKPCKLCIANGASSMLIYSLLSNTLSHPPHTTTCSNGIPCSKKLSLLREKR